MIKVLHIIFFSLLILHNTIAQTTGTLQGQVLDLNSDEGLPFARLSLEHPIHPNKVTETDFDGKYNFSNVKQDTYQLVVSYVGFPTKTMTGIVVQAGQVTIIDVEMEETVQMAEIVVAAEPLIEQSAVAGGQTLSANDIKNLPTRSVTSIVATTAGVNQADKGSAVSSRGSRANTRLKRISGKKMKRKAMRPAAAPKPYSNSKNYRTAAPPVEKPANEEYASFVENEFRAVQDEPLSTFSIDVDRASYANIRRHLNQMQKPPKDAVRIEEMINYFEYNYPQPQGEDPFSVTTEVADCPWNKAAQLVKIGLQGKNIDLEKAPASNLVFLIDVSGSMSSANKLPLLKESLKLLINNMRAQDKIAIVVYAGAAGLVQASTNDKNKLLKALDQLQAGGSTAGGAGIELAYKTAKSNLAKDGNNRVIIATDGDFNVGASSANDLEKLIVEKRKDNIFLTVLGYGMGNYKDSRMEVLADKGNGNYAYIDNIKEAKKTLVKEMGGTLYTIAKDVKIQVEFNPVQVKSYRLVGYENRLLNKEDFNNDTKDAGELGAGHTVTALYEIVLSTGKKANKAAKKVDELVYQKNKSTHLAQTSNDLMTIKLRYKKPTGMKSTLMKFPLEKKLQPISEASENFRFAASVAGFGMLLRDSKFKNDLTYKTVLELAKGAKGADKEGYRAEYIEMVSNVLSMTAQAQK
ncbi:YfbK domain-containing protein [Aureispira anguillae]|uniref:von Willebrand factor type A domain-containing protein n=1 Tax=Aureispira anguillae TaxID=2864201 RepID=A0A915YCU4_9BACT|nr:von Willebrand factor type A domain-containing protein [Aureispira anguillae]BDS10742.1 von Willebrand factor type A domain-containing protein [Aureispira anguillae]